ncbi:hypothetical protein [Sphaerisporangium perillae]|uniref:hypothetical protein n=1 Tax=Sphaerisporangium perillae TaxID=2935860 RepID=UPI00200CF4A7|nr:hypothetical protein [Sphaerisporangium perillae]
MSNEVPTSTDLIDVTGITLKDLARTDNVVVRKILRALLLDPADAPPTAGFDSSI